MSGLSTMPSNILDGQRIERIRDAVGTYDGVIQKMMYGVEDAINDFKGNEVVISLVNSGNLGSEVEHNLEVILENLEKLRGISKGLEQKTMAYTDTQARLNDSHI